MTKSQDCSKDQGCKILDLNFGSEVLEHCSKDQGYNSSKEKPYSGVGRIAPIGPMLFPEASQALNLKWLRVLSGEIKILWIRSNLT